MKRRIRKIANFFAFNLLFFALYLNFVHKDKNIIVAAPASQQASVKTTQSGTVLVESPEQTIKKEAVVATTTEHKTEVTSNDGTALKLSIN
jgi:hypothetical protein